MLISSLSHGQSKIAPIWLSKHQMSRPKYNLPLGEWCMINCIIIKVVQLFIILHFYCTTNGNHGGRGNAFHYAEIVQSDLNLMLYEVSRRMFIKQGTTNRLCFLYVAPNLHALQDFHTRNSAAIRYYLFRVQGWQSYPTKKSPKTLTCEYVLYKRKSA